MSAIGISASNRRRILSSQAFLQHRKGKDLAVPIGDNFAVGDQGVLQVSRVLPNFRELRGNIIQGSREQRRTDASTWSWPRMPSYLSST